MRHLLVALVLCSPLLSQNPLYLDPVLGIDQVGRGSAANPLKTITFALTQVPATGPATLYLRPGSYSQQSGETFPLQVPDLCTIEGDPAVIPQGVHSAVILTPLTAQFAFELGSRPVRAVVFRNLRIDGGMLGGVHLTLRGSAVFASLVIEDCQISVQRCVEIEVTANARAQVTIARSRLSSVDSAVAAHTATSAGATIDLTIDRSVLLNGISGTVVLDSRVAGGLNATLRATQVRAGVRYGVLCNSANAGPITTRFEHCLFHDNGNNTVGNITNGAIFDQSGSGGVAPTHGIVNSIFSRNRTDAASGTSANYTWGNNLVLQANLGSLGGNRVGVPGFARSSENDFHLALNSVCVDAGNAQHVTLAQDADGEPRLSPFAGAAPDLGPDEAFLGATFTSDGTRVGELYTLRTSWGASTPFAFFLATASVPNSFGPGLVHLSGPIFDLGLRGTCAANGIGEATLQIPNDPSLAGLVIYWQSVGAVAPFLGVNAKRNVVQLP